MCIRKIRAGVIDGDTVVVSSPEVTEAKNVRYAYRTGLAGIRPDAPGFARVRLAPAPGELKEIRATVPHPDGKIAVDLHFEDGAVRGSVETPVPGVFVWQGREAPLIPGSNNL